MADYTPVFLPGEVITMTASGAVSGGDLLTVSGSGTVAKLAFGTNPAVVVGVAASDTATNGKCAFYARGTVHESVAQGTVTAGDQVTTPVTGDTAGAQVKTLAAVGGAWAAADIWGARTILGVALTTASNPNKVRWMSM